MSQNSQSKSFLKEYTIAPLSKEKSNVLGMPSLENESKTVASTTKTIFHEKDLTPDNSSNKTEEIGELVDAEEVDIYSDVPHPSTVKTKGVIFHDLRKELAPDDYSNQAGENRDFFQSDELDDYSDLSHSSTKTKAAPEPVICPVCSKHFRFRSKLNRHMIVHTGEKQFVCPVCSQRFAFKQSLTYHMERHTGVTIECEICHKQFSRKYYATHVGTHGIPEIHKCSECAKSFRTQYLLMIHNCRPDADNTSFTCHVCHKQFAERRNLKRHSRTHTGEKPFECEVCNMRFTRKDILFIHIRQHTKERPYPCNLCSKEFTQSGSLREHMRTHTGEKRFECVTCGRKDFVKKSRYLKHISHHTRLQELNAMDDEEVFEKGMTKTEYENLFSSPDFFEAGPSESRESSDDDVEEVGVTGHSWNSIPRELKVGDIVDQVKMARPENINILSSTSAFEVLSCVPKKKTDQKSLVVGIYPSNKNEQKSNEH